MTDKQDEDALYVLAMSQLANPPCPPDGHDYHRFRAPDGYVWAVRCLTCGRRPIDEIASRRITPPDPA